MSKHKILARELLWSKSFQELWGDVHSLRRAELLEDLLARLRANDMRAATEISGKIEQLDDTIPEIFRIAAFTDAEPHPTLAWREVLNNPQGQKIECQLKSQKPLRRRWTEFWERIISMLKPPKTQPQ